MLGYPTSQVIARVFWTLQCLHQKEDFEKASKDALTLPSHTTDADKLILYGLFKQATIGEINTSRPGFFDMKGKAKWDAWKNFAGKSKEEAMEEYITKVKQLQEG
ncbi:hypothetical protein GOP47_0000574 [Adiantum capillus-veneris]|uniref:ACB domain-containing protein n=1 Tax=Adiantum capillus-veneris TaxID=13818 RepID=A0A9D4VD93_ADICA|nr:hypothetical protein GOP47_0000574 [Adiantum capillus-veneris]